VRSDQPRIGCGWLRPRCKRSPGVAALIGHDPIILLGYLKSQVSDCQCSRLGLDLKHLNLKVGFDKNDDGDPILPRHLNLSTDLCCSFCRYTYLRTDSLH
jgi:hypothetical protein